MDGWRHKHSLNNGCTGGCRCYIRQFELVVPTMSLATVLISFQLESKIGIWLGLCNSIRIDYRNISWRVINSVSVRVKSLHHRSIFVFSQCVKIQIITIPHQPPSSNFLKSSIMNAPFITHKNYLIRSTSWSQDFLHMTRYSSLFIAPRLSLHLIATF